jgi:micrococcal nuclease
MSNDIEFFTIKGTYDATIVKVHDGDTVHAIFKFLGTQYKFHVRLNGIDTPELRTKKLIEKEAAIKITNYLKSKILDKQVILDCQGFDKYGRLLAIITCDSININEDLINKGYAKKYDGGHKSQFTDEECKI